MHKGEEAEEAVVVGVEVAVGIGLVLAVPETLDELTGDLVVGSQGGGGEGGDEAHGVARALALHLAHAGRHGEVDLRAVHVVLVGEGVDALGVEEGLDGVGVVGLPLAVGAGPGIVEGDVHRDAPGVEAEGRLHATAKEGRGLDEGTVEVVGIRIQAGLGVDALMEILAARLRAGEIEIGAAVIGPAGPDLVEGRQVVGRIGVADAASFRGEGDEVRLLVDERLDPVGAVLGPGKVEDVLRLGEVVDLSVVAPAVGGKDERGHEIELTVGGGAFGPVRAVRVEAPGEIALHRAVLVLHVFLAPAPQAVEDVLLAQLHGDHQAIGHALGAGVLVLDVGDIGHVVPHFEIDFVRATEDLLVDLLQAGVDLCLRIPHLSEDVAVLAGLESAFLPGFQRRLRGSGEGEAAGDREENGFEGAIGHKIFVLTVTLVEQTNITTNAIFCNLVARAGRYLCSRKLNVLRYGSRTSSPRTRARAS